VTGSELLVQGNIELNASHANAVVLLWTSLLMIFAGMARHTLHAAFFARLKSSIVTVRSWPC